MDRTHLLLQLTAVFRDVFDDDSLVIAEETSAADIADWDSLTHIALIAEVEQLFGFRFPMKDVLGMQNVGDMLDVIACNKP